MWPNLSVATPLQHTECQVKMQTLVPRPREKPVASEDLTRAVVAWDISCRSGVFFLLFYYDLVRNQFVCDDLCFAILQKSTWSFFEAVNMPTSCNLMVKLVPMPRVRWRQNVHASMGLEFFPDPPNVRNTEIMVFIGIFLPLFPGCSHPWPLIAGSPVTYHNLLVPSVTLSLVPPEQDKITSKCLLNYWTSWFICGRCYQCTQSSTTIWWCQTSHTHSYIPLD